MAVEVFMPKAGMDMKEGIIIEWLKEVGDTVEKGEGLLEIETDKVSMEVEAPESGTLLKTYFNNGDAVPVVTIIGYIGEVGETVPDAPTMAGGMLDEKEEKSQEIVEEPRKVSLLQNEKLPATPYARKIALDNGIALDTIKPTGLFGEIKGRDVEAALKKAPISTPLAKRIADDMGIKLDLVEGTGHHQKIRKEDVLRVTKESKEHEMSMYSIDNNGGFMSVVIHVEALIKLKKKISKTYKMTMEDFFIKAVGKWFGSNRQYLATILENEVIFHEHANINVNGAVIQNIDQKPLSMIAVDRMELALKMKEDCLPFYAHQGSSLSLTNFGKMGVQTFVSPLKGQDSISFGMGVVENKQMILSITYDRRIFNDDAMAFLAKGLRDLLHHPLKILI